MMRNLLVWLLTFFILLCTVCSSPATDSIHVAVVRKDDTSPLQKSLEGFVEFFEQTSIELEIKSHLLKADLSNSQDVIEGIRKTDPQLILSLGSIPLRVVCPVLENAFPIVAVSLREVDFECAKNVGGVYLEYPPEIQIEWMERILPGAKKIGVIYSSEENRKKITKASLWAKQRGITILKREVSAPYQLPAALSYLSNRADVIWGISDSIVLTPETVRKILLFSFRNKVPFVGLSSAWSKAGALYALDRDYNDIGRQCAEMAYAEILGEKTVPFSAQPPRQIHYYLNLKTAQHLRVDLSSSLIQGAEESY